MNRELYRRAKLNPLLPLLSPVPEMTYTQSCQFTNSSDEYSLLLMTANTVAILSRPSWSRRNIPEGEGKQQNDEHGCEVIILNEKRETDNVSIYYGHR